MKILSILFLTLGWLLATGGLSDVAAGEHVHGLSPDIIAEAVPDVDADARPAPAKYCLTDACCAALCVVALVPPGLATAATPTLRSVATPPIAELQGRVGEALLRPPQALDIFTAR